MITVPSWYYQKGPAQVSEHVSGQTTDVAIKMTSSKFWRKWYHSKIIVL